MCDNQGSILALHTADREGLWEGCAKREVFVRTLTLFDVASSREVAASRPGPCILGSGHTADKLSN